MANPIGLTVAFNRLPTVQSALRGAALSAVERRAGVVLAVVHAYEHVVTGRMRRETHVTTGVMRNDVATVVIQSDAPYSREEEEGNRWRPGHHRVAAGTTAATPGYLAGVASDLAAAIEGAAR
jgi:hypothetical protein